MTTHTYKRCQHCGIRYSYQGSGHGCNEPLNDGTWCPQCKQAVLDALKALPRHFECRYRNIQEMTPRFEDVTLERLLEWERVQLAPRAEGRIIGQQIWPALYNVSTGDSQTTRGIRCPQGRQFRLSTWRINPEVIIDTPMESSTRRWNGTSWPQPGQVSHGGN